MNEPGTRISAITILEISHSNKLSLQKPSQQGSTIVSRLKLIQTTNCIKQNLFDRWM